MSEVGPPSLELVMRPGKGHIKRLRCLVVGILPDLKILMHASLSSWKPKRTLRLKMVPQRAKMMDPGTRPQTQKESRGVKLGLRGGYRRPKRRPGHEKLVVFGFKNGQKNGYKTHENPDVLQTRF